MYFNVQTLEHQYNTRYGEAVGCLHPLAMKTFRFKKSEIIRSQLYKVAGDREE